jgi:hypothetical protein
MRASDDLFTDFLDCEVVNRGTEHAHDQIARHDLGRSRIGRLVRKQGIDETQLLPRGTSPENGIALVDVE